MADDEATDTRGGDRRGTDRRNDDRRRQDRRAPPPPWRRPPALVAYGAVAALLVVFVLRGCGGDTPRDVATAPPIAPAPPPVDTSHAPAPARNAPAEPAMATGDFERLTLEAEHARGRLVQAQLYCDAPANVAVQASVDTVEAGVAQLVDPQTHSVPAAECKWGAQDDPRRQDFLLLVPADLAAEFASQPVVADGYFRRRRVVAKVEWIGKSRALALQTVGVFRGLVR